MIQSESDSEEIRKKARLRLLGLLQRRSYTEYQLRDKLSKSGYVDTVIDDAIVYVADLHLIDDSKYCRDYITYSSERKSRRRIRADLRQKGVPVDIIEEAFDSVLRDGDLADEEQLIRRLMAKRHYDPETATFEDMQKMKAYLYGKGFDPDTIGQCIK